MAGAVCVGKYTIRRQLGLTWSVGAAMRTRTCGEKRVKEGGGEEEEGGGKEEDRHSIIKEEALNSVRGGGGVLGTCKTTLPAGWKNELNKS